MIIKICKNHKYPKRGECGHNPGYKYDMIYDVIIYNLNPITKKVYNNKCDDETTWVHRGYGGTGSGLTG